MAWVLRAREEADEVGFADVLHGGCIFENLVELGEVFGYLLFEFDEGLHFTMFLQLMILHVAQFNSKGAIVSVFEEFDEEAGTGVSALVLL